MRLIVAYQIDLSILIEIWTPPRLKMCYLKLIICNLTNVKKIFNQNKILLKLKIKWLI